MPDEPASKVFVRRIQEEPRPGGMTALTLSIHYALDTEAEAKILVRPGRLLPPNADNVRREILRLGQALQGAAQSPQGISGFPEEEP
jgi:hypothetical protein